MLRGVTHAVGAVLSVAWFGGDAVADAVAETADDAEEIAYLIFGDIVGDAGESIEHAFAELLVGGGWELGGGLP